MSRFAFLQTIQRPVLLSILLAVALTGPTRGDLIVGNDDSAHTGIRAFADGANGNVAPLRTIAGASIGRGRALAVDSLHNEIVFAQVDYARIDVFNADATGAAAPLRTIFGAATQLISPISASVDVIHNEIAVLDYSPGSVPEVRFYSRTANGNAAPLRKITGPLTRLGTNPHVLAFDPEHNEILVTNGSTILFFSRLASGNVPPAHTIEGPATQLSNPWGIAVDAAHDEILVADYGSPAVLTFARGVHGNTAPKRRFACSAFVFPLYIALLGNDEVALTNYRIPGPEQQILVFGRTATGTVAARRTISGAATGLAYPVAIAVLHRPLVVAGSRFAIEASWRTASAAGGGVPHPLTSDTGTFYFFNPENLEVVIKVLNGCPVNNRFWVFAGGLTNVLTGLRLTDLATGAQRVYDNPQGKAFVPIQDTSAFATCNAPVSDPAMAPDAIPAVTDGASTVDVIPDTGPCTGLCLNNGRFDLHATWRDAQGNTGSATGVAVTGDTGYLWFFNASNVEVLIKALNACGVNGKFWVFAGGLTNVRVDITVRDTLTNATKTYHNDLNHAFQPVQDTVGFGCI